MTNLTRLLCFTVALCLCAGCQRNNETVRRSFDVQLSEGQSPRVMTSSRLERLREGLRNIRGGEDKDSIVALIGQPDEIEIIGPKRRHSPAEEREALVYDVALVGASRGNVRDRIVTLYSAGKLTAINSNVDGIESRFEF